MKLTRSLIIMFSALLLMAATPGSKARALTGGAPPDSVFLLHTPAGQLFGSLLVPAGTKPVPLVLLIAGSGPTDRNGNNNMGLQCNAYQMIADSLWAHGIASLRYDKRGVGMSAAAMMGKTEADLRFEDYINDAVLWVDTLKKDVRFSKIIVLGHSEGSLIGIEAMRLSKADALISVAGIGRPMDVVLMEQLKSQPQAMQEEAAKILASLKKGHTVSPVPKDLESLFRENIQPYWISWLKYDAAKDFDKIKKPALLLQGTTDLQVKVVDANALSRANPAATLKVITGMNHVLKEAPEDPAQNMLTYSDPDKPLHPALLPAIFQFIQSLP